MKQPLLEVKSLKVLSGGGRELVRDVSLTVNPGEILGLVGESGCGKSMTALAVAGLLPRGITVGRGSIHFAGQDLSELSTAERRELNGDRIGMVFQDALAALNPLQKVGKQISELLLLHTDLDHAARRKCTYETMRAVGLNQAEELADRYPHELSGGQRQRVLIAMAIIAHPQLLIADEPTTALDVAVQDQILDVLRKISLEEGVGILYISHDLGTVRRLCDRVCVLYAGMVAETGPTEVVLSQPAHEYTKMLLAALPTPDKRGKRLSSIAGRLPDTRGPARNCLFSERCPVALPRCRQEIPAMKSVGEQHCAACFLNKESKA